MAPTVPADPAPAPEPYVKRSKDLAGVDAVTPYKAFDTLYTELVTNAPPQPTDNGRVTLIVERPSLNGRTIVPSASLTVDGGMANSGWTLQPGRGPIDQICVTSAASMRAIAGSDDRVAWAAAGDQLFFDLDLSENNLATGDRVVIGAVADPAAVVLQVTTKRHTGCTKFDRRYGPGALKVVSVPAGRALRLRGIYFHVVRSGVVREGDCITKVARDFGDA